jgi:hypothetical protein
LFGGLDLVFGNGSEEERLALDDRRRFALGAIPEKLQRQLGVGRLREGG